MTRSGEREAGGRRLGAVGALLLPWWIHEHNRPRLVEARIVLATDADPVFREGSRHVASDEKVRLAIALRLERPSNLFIGNFKGDIPQVQGNLFLSTRNGFERFEVIQGDQILLQVPIV